MNFIVASHNRRETLVFHLASPSLGLLIATGAAVTYSLAFARLPGLLGLYSQKQMLERISR